MDSSLLFLPAFVKVVGGMCSRRSAHAIGLESKVYINRSDSHRESQGGSVLSQYSVDGCVVDLPVGIHSLPPYLDLREGSTSPLDCEAAG